MKQYLKAHWKQIVLAAASGAAAAYAGPAGYQAAQQYLPVVCAAVGLC